MFFKVHQLIFLVVLFSGSMISLSANSWFTVWLGLEINLMSMIPLILIKLNPKLTESAIKYFLAQAMASILMIFSVTLNFFFYNIITLDAMELLLISSISMKLGAAPFHFWFPQVTVGLNWTQNILIFTWQKVAPFFVIMTLSSKYLILISMFSALVGALGGFNQLVMKLTMTYSSISHTGWMLSASLLSENFWLSYFFMYSLLSIVIIHFFMKNSIYKINQVFSCSDSTLNKYVAAMNILSLGGLPPLMGFIAKLSVIIILVKKNMIVMFLIMITASLISLFFYVRIIYSSMMSNTKTFKNKTHAFKPFSSLFFLSVFFNLMCPVMFFLT
uniref:NADH-ubiquinone oxidoreductase chain 2 n=1 Tax=Salina celebensis TaxID=1588069 RepID=A0A6G6A4P0_9HEXA|nr:NADH dehydrogenase subunit 2 [Salina celebensis]QID03173.1 NADH dehydrogenase subunit 2 [Salina celebensis]